MHMRKLVLTRHRHRRLVLWTLAMLAWIASIVLGGMRTDARRLRQRGDVSLDWLRRWVMKLVVVRAGEIARPRARRPRFWRGRDQRRSHLFRALIGSAFRRALRHRDIAERVRRMTHVLRNLDAYADRIAKRMRRRLTRLWPIAARPAPATALADAALPRDGFADSS